MSEQSLESLLSLVEDLRQQNAALRRKVEHLEERLEQRFEVTVKNYQKLLPYLENMRAKVLQIFFELPPASGLTHEEIQEEFKAKFPMLNVTNIPRRTYELVEQRKLYSRQEEGRTKYYLRLLPDLPTDRKETHGQAPELACSESQGGEGIEPSTKRAS